MRVELSYMTSNYIEYVGYPKIFNIDPHFYNITLVSMWNLDFFYTYNTFIMYCIDII